VRFAWGELPFGLSSGVGVNREDALAEVADIPEEMDRLRAGIAALAARRRARIEALLADGMTQAEIARRLRVTQRAIAKLIGR
jgi:DNA-directed RNA polymerase specialized sigma24 family protein